MEDREVTPPHHPTHGIHLSNDEINEIVQIFLPLPSTNYVVSRLAHGKSFNNRIYFINSVDESQQSYALKVNGQFWGPAKVENEVRCLRLLQQFCPNVPTPRVIAWSTDGRGVDRSDATDHASRSVQTACKQGWILMTRLPGEPIDPHTLTGEEASTLSAQLVQTIHSWRTQVPTSDRCGNLRLQSDNIASKASFGKGGLGVDLDIGIEGILDINMPPTEHPMDSLLSYWHAKLSHSVKWLTTNHVYSANRDSLEPVLLRFLRTTLPRLSIFSNTREQTNGFVFSHTDLSPRSVLTVGSPPQITGIVDFEFSGFFPWMQEFMGTSLVPPDDENDHEAWPVPMLDQILKQLEDRGVETPIRLKGSKQLAELMNLAQLETYIAPWWLSANGIPVDALSSELTEAKSKVEVALSALQGDE